MSDNNIELTDDQREAFDRFLMLAQDEFNGHDFENEGEAVEFLITRAYQTEVIV